MKLNDLTLRDAEFFYKNLRNAGHGLSVYAFANIYIWKSLFDIKWALLDKSLCVFFRDKIGAFLYLSPLCAELDRAVIKEVFGYLDSINANREISRIENVEAKDIGFYRKLGLICREKSIDYVCLRKDLAGLTGDRFRHKRAAANYFIKNYEHEFVPYTNKDINCCLKLYRQWAADRARDNPDPVYRGMMQDSLKALSLLLKDPQKLNCLGRVVKVGGRIKGFTFGYKLDPETFCILYEITDLCVKGLAQFIFRAFCRELEDYKYINIMDDSGLENLKKVKLSYRPVKLIPAYIVTR